MSLTKAVSHSNPKIFDKHLPLRLVSQIKSSNPYVLLTNCVYQINGTTIVGIFINVLGSNEGKGHQRIYWVRARKRPHPECDLELEGFWPKRDRLNEKAPTDLDKGHSWKNPNLVIRMLTIGLSDFIRCLQYPDDEKIPVIHEKSSLDEVVSPIENSEGEYDDWCLKSNFVQHDKFSNIFYLNPEIASSSTPTPTSTGLRPIILDGSNIAMAHGMHQKFSPEGITICVNYFLQKGHEVKVFLPQSRKRNFNSKILSELETQNIVVFTPSRIVGGKCVNCYDDRYMIQYAAVSGGIVVSNDFFRDLYEENVEWRDTLKTKILPFTWASRTCLMFPTDPLGRNGPTFEEFLKFQ